MLFPAPAGILTISFTRSIVPEVVDKLAVPVADAVQLMLVNKSLILSFTLAPITSFGPLLVTVIVQLTA